MSTSISSCAVVPPPIAGGGAPGAQSPMQVSPAASGGGPQSPMQVPMAPSAVQGAAGGGALAQPAATPAPVPVPTPEVGAQPAAPVAGGGGTDMSAVLASLQQVVTTLTALITQLQGQVGGAQAQAGAAGVRGGGAATGVAGDAGTVPDASAPAGTAPMSDPGAAVEGGGAPAKDPVQAPPSGGGCGCGCAMGAAQGVAQSPDQGSPTQADSGKDERKSGDRPAKADEMKSSPAQGGDGKLDSDALTVKGRKMTPEQRRLTEIVLRKGTEMGANRKVLETAVATMIQESEIKNDASVDSKDHDSLGLFQQRPSAGWGTRAQISDPEYAAKKFFEKAIPNDRKNPAQAKTQLAQSVQISAFPDAYARWDKEAEQVVADYLG